MKLRKLIETYYLFKDEGEKEYIVYHYLNKIIRYLKECEVMEVFDNHMEAFDIMFHNIISFFINSKCCEKPKYIIVSL